MDGTFAVLFALFGLADMGMNYCSSGGCFARSDAQAGLSISAGQVYFQEQKIDEEAYLRYEFSSHYGPFQPIAGVSVTGGGDAWVGFGASWRANLDQLYFELHLMPGLYSRRGGPDLGHAVEFRSGAEVGYEARNGVRVGLSFDHRSNAELSSTNPGLETVQLRVTVPFGRRAQ